MRTSILLLFAVATTAFTAGRIAAPNAPSDKPRATGIGGVFFKSKDPAALRGWYNKYLGMPMNKYGAFVHAMDPDSNKLELWAPIATVFSRLDQGTTVK